MSGARGTFYKVLGFFVWRAQVRYFRRRYGQRLRIGAALGAIAVTAYAGYALTRRGTEPQ